MIKNCIHNYNKVLLVLLISAQLHVTSQIRNYIVLDYEIKSAVVRRSEFWLIQ